MKRPRLDGLPIWPGIVAGAIGGALISLASYVAGTTVPPIVNHAPQHTEEP